MSYADSPFLQYEFGVEHKGNDYYINLKLYENADISIEARPIEEAGAQILVPDILWASINPFLFEQLHSSAINLSQQETQEFQNQIVCELYVPYIMQVNHLSLTTPYNEETQNFASTLKVVKGPEGCWVPHSFHFTDEKNNERADIVKTKLRNWFQQSAFLEVNRSN